MKSRQRVIGVDFSGALDAGNRIWIATAARTGDGVAVEDCVRARDLPGGAAARDPALAALTGYLSAQTGAVAGLDFPFSLPLDMIAAPSWSDFVSGFSARFGSADGFRDDCLRRGNGRELKRRTDRDARVPFGVYNLRLYRQTWAGIADVLAPLLSDDRARVIPMQEPTDGKIVIAEICPASILKAAGMYPSYKGRETAHRRARAAIIRGFHEAGRLAPLPRRLRNALLEDSGGDALDAVIAAIGAAELASPVSPQDLLDRMEGRIYF